MCWGTGGRGVDGIGGGGLSLGGATEILSRRFVLGEFSSPLRAAWTAIRGIYHTQVKHVHVYTHVHTVWLVILKL